MAVTWANVVGIAPPLAAVVDTAVQDQILGYARSRCNASSWGAQLDMGVTYLAAHLATMRNLGAAGGPVSSEGVGPLQVSYAAVATAKALETTGYGREYLALIRELPTTIGLVP